ncbi:hypothetical protein CCACVL1_14735 [Corchorus capsularis]|uniref:DUF4283 domain-containing protein n=1 Tax=Corchorus capsularis TaxID=210143 RepID=A0A1R3I5S7_COCAP|nr:hypothetical protein CCACVL1_14735 [Corchorus capsularis]
MGMLVKEVSEFGRVEECYVPSMEAGDGDAGQRSGREPESIPYDVCPFWVRVFGLPPLMMNAKIGLEIGESMGYVHDVDPSGGRFLRHRVELNILKPIKNGTTITTPNGDLDVELQYEKSPDFCWGKMAAREIVEKEKSCEIVSKFRAKEVEAFSREVEVTSKCVCGLAEDHGIIKAAENKGVLHGITDLIESGESVPLLHHHAKKVAVTLMLEGDQLSGSKISRIFYVVSIDYIPGVGPSQVGSKLNLGGAVGSRPVELYEDNGLGLVDLSNPSPKEQFGLGIYICFWHNTSSGERRFRKWKKNERVSAKYSFDILALQSNLKDGRKREFAQSRLHSNGAGPAKRSRDREDELEAVKLGTLRLHIVAHVVVNLDGTWRFMSFYGHPETSRRSESWVLLKLLASRSSLPLPWMCAGDFNEILSNDEKIGGPLRPQ